MSAAEATPSTPSAPAPLRAAVGQAIGVVLFTLLYRREVHGRERVPRDGALVLVANHSGFLDGPLVFTVAPRPSNFLVKQQMFHGIFGVVLRAVGQIPIDRTRGDRAALDVARAVLARGGVVGVFPEGTRGRGDVQQVNQGAAWLALQSGARIVPVAVLGTRSPGRSAGSLPRLRSRLVVEFGDAFDLTPDSAMPGRQRLKAATEQLRHELATHVAAASDRLGIALPDAPGRDDVTSHLPD